MTKFYGFNILLNMQLAALTFAIMILSSQCRLLIDIEDEEESDTENKSILELSSRDEIVKMAGYGEDKLSTVLITGTVVCSEACSASKRRSQTRHDEPISGALVVATCKTNILEYKKLSSAEAVTDEYGEFMIDLPSHLHAIPDLDKACTVKVLQLPKNFPCHQSGFGKEKQGIIFSSVGNGIRTYTAGKIVFQDTSPKNSLEACTKGLEDHEMEMSW